MFGKNIRQNICSQDCQMPHSKREGEFETGGWDNEFTIAPQTSDVVGCFWDSKKCRPRDGIVSISTQITPEKY